MDVKEKELEKMKIQKIYLIKIMSRIKKRIKKKI